MIKTQEIKYNKKDTQKEKEPKKEKKVLTIELELTKVIESELEVEVEDVLFDLGNKAHEKVDKYLEVIRDKNVEKIRDAIMEKLREDKKYQEFINTKVKAKI